MKKLKKKVLYVMAFGAGEGFKAKNYAHLSLSEIYWRCPPFGESSVRSTLSACLSEGMVARSVRDGKSLYRLTSIGREAINRVFGADYVASTSDKSWIMVVLNQGELSEKLVRRFGVGMDRLGLKSWSRGVWLTPLTISENIKRYIMDIGVGAGVVVVEVKKWVLGDEKSLVEQLWKPQVHGVEVKKIITQASSLLTIVRSSKSLTQQSKDDFLVISDRWYGLCLNKPKLPRYLQPEEVDFEQAEKIVLKLCQSVLELEREASRL